MKQTKLSNRSDILLPKIILGAWGIGGPPFWKNRNAQDSIKTIETAIDGGISAIDTAPVYGFGLSEELVGKAIKGKRDQLIIASKYGLRWRSNKLADLYHDCSPASIEEEINNSLDRLGTDRIDLYQVHWPDENTPIADTMETMEKLVSEGKIISYGISNYSEEQMKEASRSGNPVSCQPCYNMLQREIESDILPYCQSADIGVIPYSPLASGVLTGKYERNQKFDDWRGKKNFGLFHIDKWATAMDKVEQLKTLAADYNVGLLSISIQWVLRQPGVVSAIVGANHPDQVTQNIESLHTPILDNLWQEIDSIIVT